MPITQYPQAVQKSNQLYINAGITYSGSLTTLSGTNTVVPAVQNVAGSGVGSGYQKINMGGNLTLSWNTTALSNKYGHIWYTEIYNPFVSYSSTVSLSINTTVAATAQPGATQITVANASGIVIGMFVEGPGEGYASGLYGAANTVAQISGNSITLTNAIPNTGQGTGISGAAIVPGTPIQFVYATGPGTVPTGSSFLPLTSTTGLVVGAPLSGGVAAGTTVSSIQSGSNVVGLSTPTTATITAGTAVTSTSTLTWGGTINWHNNVVPTQAAPGRSLYQFYSPDGGTTIYGRQVMATLAGA